jgi:hypothetical protein
MITIVKKRQTRWTDYMPRARQILKESRERWWRRWCDEIEIADQRQFRDALAKREAMRRVDEMLAREAQGNRPG